jgi:putative flippase GtrA
MGTLTRSALVGVAATAVDLATLAVLVESLRLAPAAANVPALLAGLLAQFLGNKLVAFGDRSPAWLGQGARFALVEAGALLLNAVLFQLLTAGAEVPYLGARALASAAVYFLYSYPLWGRIFRAPEGGRADQGWDVPSLPAGTSRTSPSGPRSRDAAPRAAARPSAFAPTSPVPGDIG